MTCKACGAPSRRGVLALSAAMVAVILLLCSALGTSAGFSLPNGRSTEEVCEDALSKARTLTQGKLGESAIGAGAGLVCGLACKKLQSTVMNTLLIGGGVCGGAVALGLVKPEDVKSCAQEKLGAAQAFAQEKVGATSEDELLDMYGGLRKFAAGHRALVGGFAGGCAVGYGLG